MPRLFTKGFVCRCIQHADKHHCYDGQPGTGCKNPAGLQCLQRRGFFLPRGNGDRLLAGRFRGAFGRRSKSFRLLLALVQPLLNLQRFLPSLFSFQALILPLFGQRSV